MTIVYQPNECVLSLLGTILLSMGTGILGFIFGQAVVRLLRVAKQRREQRKNENKEESR